MVRVFSIYQFDGQSIHRIPDDIRSASLIDATHLALAKSDHVIEIISLEQNHCDDSRFTAFTADPANDNNTQTKYAFPTVDEVVEMAYCKFGKMKRFQFPTRSNFKEVFFLQGNFIATIERKVSNNGVEHSFCRVYTNWTNCKNAASDTDDINLMTCNVTIRARIAGRVTPSTNNVNCLEVIEIPTIGEFN